MIRRIVNAGYRNPRNKLIGQSRFWGLKIDTSDSNFIGPSSSTAGNSRQEFDTPGGLKLDVDTKKEMEQENEKKLKITQNTRDQVQKMTNKTEKGI